MEASREYLMWMKRKQIMLRSHERTSSSSSWEERAFAEDAARILGGCIWPPRSYSCSFCKREFRSAQALGGHMNVHRRDRAKLKQQTLIGPKPDQEVTINGAYREEHFKSFSQGHSNYVDTGLSMGLLPTEEDTNCKRAKISNISSVLPVFLKPCSNDHRGLVFQSTEIVLGVNKPKMEDLDLELRLGKPQKVK